MRFAAENAGPMVDVHYGPIGPQWCSNALIEAVAEASARSGRRIHMHLLESARQRLWLDRRFPQGVVRYLDEIGFLSPRLAVAHGVQLREDELELLAERGVRVVSNPSANLRLRSGSRRSLRWRGRELNSRSASTARALTMTRTSGAKCGSPACCMAATA